MMPIQKLLLFGKKITNFYKAGIEYVPWVEGSKVGDTPTYTENTDHIYLEAIYSTTNTYIAGVTNVPVDLTKIKTLVIDMENAGINSSNTYVYIIADIIKAGGYADFTARTFLANSFARGLNTLDVSRLTGSYYIRIHARAGVAGASSLVKLYGVWGLM